MLNPIPKNALFATLNANEVAELIDALPKKYQKLGYQIYFGTINNCSEIVSETIKAYTDQLPRNRNHKGYRTPTEAEDGIKDIDRAVIHNRRPDW